MICEYFVNTRSNTCSPRSVNSDLRSNTDSVRRVNSDSRSSRIARAASFGQLSVAVTCTLGQHVVARRLNYCHRPSHVRYSNALHSITSEVQRISAELPSPRDLSRREETRRNNREHADRHVPRTVKAFADTTFIHHTQQAHARNIRDCRPMRSITHMHMDYNSPNQTHQNYCETQANLRHRPMCLTSSNPG